MRTKFDDQLTKLNTSLIEMGAAIENSISTATEALINKDIELAKQTLAHEDEIDEREKNIEALCLKLLLQQQPVASDLRVISAALKIITDMERIGDHATDISEITILLSKSEYIKKLEHIPQMAEAAIKMVRESVDAFVKKDTELAKSVIAHDDVVDDLFQSIKDDLYELMVANVENCKQALDLLMVAKYYERIGDHAVNIAEWVVFSITGEHIKEMDI